MPADTIKITGARQHNLKNISVEIPRNQLVVVTGMSGSGKSSLAFNTLYAEGQRRYVESLSAYARQFLDQLEKPDVDFIEGLSPAIAIEQRTSSPNPRSTIATATEIYDYLRILYSACGQPHDPATGEAIHRKTVPDIISEIEAMPEGTRLILLAPLPKSETRHPKKLFERLAKQGLVRVRVSGEIYDLEDDIPIEKGATPKIEAVIDRLVVREGLSARLMDSIQTALRWSQNDVWFLVEEHGNWELHTYTTAFANPETGFRMPELTPRHFSFNSHHGACTRCQGLGSELFCDPDLLVPDRTQTLTDGAVKSWWARNPKLKALHDAQLQALIAHFEIDQTVAFEKLPHEFERALFYGTGTEAIKSGWKTSAKTKSVSKPFEGLCVQASRLYETSESESTRKNLMRFMNPRPCGACEGKRLKPEILAVTLPGDGGRPLSIDDFTKLTIENAAAWLRSLKLTKQQKEICSEVVNEIRKRVSFLVDVGLGYLTLSRENGSLSGGESQRIRLATQIGSGLAGVLYVLDEPSIGLHQKDNARLIETLKRLRDLGNSVVVVEHDEETIRASDYVIDLGPGPGPRGGEIIALGTPEEISANPKSLTGRYMSGALTIPVPKHRIQPPPPGGAPDSANILDTGWLTVHGAAENNLREIDAAFPIGCLTCVTGVSGSGKSTLVDDILRRTLCRNLYRSKETPGKHRSISGQYQIDKVIVIDQSAIGRSPRSNPATYTGAFTAIRELFSQLPTSKLRGFTPGTFSFNTKGGRCESCQGDGLIKIDMHFLSDVYVHCEACSGRRYNQDTLDIHFKGKNIAEVLDMSLDEAVAFFRRVPGIHDKIKTLCDVGLGYLKLGQSATTLSGGEAQRIKLSAELAKKATGRTLYILDEPTTGLHFADIETLLRVLMRLRDAGNTLIVIEHNLDVIKCADWILDLGPGGGAHGGNLVVEGAPEVIANCSESATGSYLRNYL
ncbi:MAG: excinuclease ABC subunit A [Verrucomicrobiales bacterium]|jgi:excinuclease ABC subunit A